ncbi:MAG: ABC transporter ATP-binding protein/permease [Culicoidibacterales bacterium]
MMINKRLIELCPKTKQYIVFTVMSQLVILLSNIGIIYTLGQIIHYFVSTPQLDGVSQATSVFAIQVTTSLTVSRAAIVFILLLIIKYGAYRLQGKYSYLAAADARTTLRTQLYDKLLQLGVHYQEAGKTATLVQIAVDGIEQLEVYFGRYLPQFFYALLAPVVLFGVISTISVSTAVVFIVCVPLIPVSIIAIMKIAKRILHAYWGNYADLGATFLENIQGLTTLKLFQQDKAYHDAMNDEAERFRKSTMKVLSMQLNSITIMDIVAFGGAAVGSIVALYQYQQGLITIGGLFIIILLAAEFFIPLRLLGSYFHIAMNGMAASDRIFAVLDYEHPEKLTQSKKYPKIIDAIDVRNLSVSFEQRTVLKNVNATFKANEVTAIVGTSGSGKSTLARVLSKQLLVDEQKVFYGTADIAALSSSILAKHVGFVDAHSYIFTGTIADNLRLANPQATIEMMMQALTAARLHGFVQNSKEGLDTFVGESGSELSGGQKQRLALARMILADRDVYIFDEATSNIDVESEEAIWDAIYELGRLKTVIVITHRLANVKTANMIHVLERGELVESGTHETLLTKNGQYAELVLQQEQLEKIREVRK